MNHKIDILYLASHGFAVRMVTQTDLLGLLTDQGLNVGIVTSDKEDKTLKDYCNSRGVKVFEFMPKLDFYFTTFRTLRTYALEDVLKNPALYEKHLRNIQPEINFRRRFKYHGYYALYKIFKLFPFLRKIFVYFDQRSLKSDDASALINNIDPRLVVSTYPVSVMEAMLLHAAKPELGRKRVIHLLSWDNITAKGRFSQMAEHYIAWGNIMKDELKKYYGVTNDKISVTGVPHFDLHHKCSDKDLIRQYLIEIGLNPNIPYLFFGMSSPYFAPGEIDIVEQIAEWVEEKKFGAIQLVVRPHPQNVQGNMADLSWLPRLRSIQSKSVYVDYPKLNSSRINWSMQLDDMQHLSFLIGGSAIVLNSVSTISIDALVHNKPVILTMFDGGQNLPWFKSVSRISEYEHLNKILNLGGIIQVNDFIELEKSLNDFLLYPDYNEPDRRKTVFEECYIQDGRATSRVINVLNTLVKTN